ncbi:hypothetical protein C4577_03380 [Candidatus Parcubacteria bacterium]|nr:MAG: hypothetical protein C4577_03380 [Candidatus Parcubacteria bacterium]
MSAKLFFVILLILGGIIISGLVFKPAQPLQAQNLNQASSEQLGALSPQVKTVGEIEIEVVPVSVAVGKNITFSLVMDNHSVDLDYDFLKIATLTDDRGNSYKAQSWTGSGGGHHIKGELIFPSLSKMPKSLILTLNGVDNKSEAFIWQL